MSITSYSELKTATANWLARSDLTSYIPDFITLGEARIYRDCKFRQMETALSSTIASGVIAVPSGYLSMKFAYVDGSDVVYMERMSHEQLLVQYPQRSADGKPCAYARNGTNFEFGPYPDSAYTIKGVYYKKLDALSDSNTSNWLITDVPDLILWAALAEAGPFTMDDAKTALYEQKYAQVLAAAKKQQYMEESSGSSLMSRPA